MTEATDMSMAEEPKRLISNQQKLQGKDTRVIFEYAGDTIMRLYVCIAKENDAPPIKGADLKVTLVDSASSRLRLLRRSPEETERLVESSSGSTTAQAMFEFARTPGQNPLYANVELGRESKLFQLEDAQPFL
jgi:hypothetical protein